MTDTTVTRFPGVYRRSDSAVFSFILRAPADLQHHFPGPWAERGSLGTRDLREANDLARVKHEGWARRFAAMRKADNPDRVTMNPTLTATIAAEVRRWVLEADDNLRGFPEGTAGLLAREERARLLALAEESKTSPLAAILPPSAFASALTIGATPAGQYETKTSASTKPEHDPLGGLSEDQHGALARFNAEGAAVAVVDMARQNLRGVLPLVQAVTKTMGLVVDWTTPEARDCLKACLKSYRVASEEATLRDAGEVVETPEPPTHALPVQPQNNAAPAPTTKHTALDAFDAWEAQKPGRPRKTVVTYKAAAEKLGTMLAGKHLEDITRQDGRDVVAKLMQDAQSSGGNAQNTAANILGRFKTLLAQAVDLEWIDKNPLQGRTIGRVKRTRKPWLVPELVTLFDDPLFTRYEIPGSSMAGQDAAYWLPLLGLYTGARISELAQLGTKDVTHDQEAGWVLSITEDAEDGQRVKNSHSIRVVPVHPELERLGFIDYWQAIVKHGQGPLWPAVVRTELNGAGGEVSKWFGKYKTAKGFGPEWVFHSFRHTLETQLRSKSIPQSQIDAIAGHAKRASSDDYDHPTPDTLRPALERLTFPGLNLPRVFEVPAWSMREARQPPAKKFAEG